MRVDTAPKASGNFLGGTQEIFGAVSEDLLGGAGKAENAKLPGAGIIPKLCPMERAGTETMHRTLLTIQLKLHEQKVVRTRQSKMNLLNLTRLPGEWWMTFYLTRLRRISRRHICRRGRAAHTLWQVRSLNHRNDPSRDR
jgi:hypothetical protein